MADGHNNIRLEAFRMKGSLGSEKMWNSLSNIVVSAGSVGKGKKRLDTY